MKVELGLRSQDQTCRKGTKELPKQAEHFREARALSPQVLGSRVLWSSQVERSG